MLRMRVMDTIYGFVKLKIQVRKKNKISSSSLQVHSIDVFVFLESVFQLDRTLYNFISVWQMKLFTRYLKSKGCVGKRTIVAWGG